MSDQTDSSLEQVREVLLSAEQAEIAALHREIQQLHHRLHALESMLVEQDDRANTVGTVLPEAFNGLGLNGEKVSLAMKPTAVRAIHHSARDESEDLAIALYPVLGPAVRKMIASLLSFGPPDGGTFVVEQVLLIERESALLLAATTIDGKSQDADVVSGMLDAIRLFVQDAFDTPEHDGLQDLRVGNISVLVEWGPRAVLASVVRGVPDDAYRFRAARVLEDLHRDYEGQLSAAAGISTSLDDAVPALQDLRTSPEPEKESLLLAGLVLLLITIAVVVVLLITL